VRKESSAITEPQLLVRLKGPAVGPGRLAARDLADLARLLDEAVLRIGRVVARRSDRWRRPSARELEEACRLYLISWTSGSAVAGFDLAEPRTIAGCEQLPSDCLTCFVRGLSQIIGSKKPDTSIPHGFDVPALKTITAFGKLLDHGIDIIEFQLHPEKQGLTAIYDAFARDLFRALADRERARRMLTGRRLFIEEAQRLMPEEELPVLGPSPEVESSFWRSAPIEQLAADQGVPPFTTISDLDAIWAEGDVFDDALSELLRDRAERRRNGSGYAR
jgi:hypothetical protein